MSGVLKLTTEASAETFKTRLDQQRDAVSRSKVQML